MPVRSSGAHNHASRLSDMIRHRMSETMPMIVEACISDAAERAPTVDEEYNELNAESGQSALVPRAGDRSNDSDGRTRFLKPETTYLKNAIVNLLENSRTMSEGGIFIVSVGSERYLNRVSHFSYINLGANGGVIKHTVPASPDVGYFTMFEAGIAGFEVRPHTVRKNGTPYSLKPGEGEDDERDSMVKSITGRHMFMPLYLQKAAGAVLLNALAEIGPGRAT